MSSRAGRRRSARRCRRKRSRRLFAILWWAHIGLVAAFLCYLPFSKHLHIATSFPNIWFRKLAPRGELPEMDLEDENATFGLKTLQDLGWKDLLDGFTCTECGRCQEACPAHAHREAAQPQDLHHGHPRHVGRRGGRAEPHPELPDRARDVRARRRAARGGRPGRADRRHGDPVRRGLGLRDLRGVRGGLPGAHRARRQDRRAAPQPGPRGIALPAGADAGVPGHGGPGQPVGPAGVGAAGLDAAVAVRGADGGVGAPRPASSTASRSCTGSAAPRRSIRATRRSPGRWRRASMPPASRSRSSGRRNRAPAIPARRMGNDYVFQMLAGAAVDTLNRYGWASGRS